MSSSLRRRPYHHPGSSTSSAPRVHHVTCDSCFRGNFSGKRYKCLRCYDFDICSVCFDSQSQRPPSSDHVSISLPPSSRYRSRFPPPPRIVSSRISSSGGAATSTAALPPLRSPVGEEAGSPSTEGRHSPSHPMQCILTRGAIDVFFAGDDGSMGDALQCYTCPLCGVMGLTQTQLFNHVFSNHSEPEDTEVLCPICCCSPTGDPNLLTEDLWSHFVVDHGAASSEGQQSRGASRPLRHFRPTRSSAHARPRGGIRGSRETASGASTTTEARTASNTVPLPDIFFGSAPPTSTASSARTRTVERNTSEPSSSLAEALRGFLGPPADSASAELPHSEEDEDDDDDDDDDHDDAVMEEDEITEEELDFYQAADPIGELLTHLTTIHRHLERNSSGNSNRGLSSASTSAAAAAAASSLFPGFYPPSGSASSSAAPQRNAFEDVIYAAAGVPAPSRGVPSSQRQTRLSATTSRSGVASAMATVSNTSQAVSTTLVTAPTAFSRPSLRGEPRDERFLLSRYDPWDENGTETTDEGKSDFVQSVLLSSMIRTLSISEDELGFTTTPQFAIWPFSEPNGATFAAAAAAIATSTPSEEETGNPYLSTDDVTRRKVDEDPSSNQPPPWNQRRNDSASTTTSGVATMQLSSSSSASNLLCAALSSSSSASNLGVENVVGGVGGGGVGNHFPLRRSPSSSDGSAMEDRRTPPWLHGAADGCFATTSTKCSVDGGEVDGSTKSSFDNDEAFLRDVVQVEADNEDEEELPRPRRRDEDDDYLPNGNFDDLTDGIPTRSKICVSVESQDKSTLDSIHPAGAGEPTTTATMGTGAGDRTSFNLRNQIITMEEETENEECYVPSPPPPLPPPPPPPRGNVPFSSSYGREREAECRPPLEYEPLSPPSSPLTVNRDLSLPPPPTESNVISADSSVTSIVTVLQGMATWPSNGDVGRRGARSDEDFRRRDDVDVDDDYHDVADELLGAIGGTATTTATPPSRRKFLSAATSSQSFPTSPPSDSTSTTPSSRGKVDDDEKRSSSAFPPVDTAEPSFPISSTTSSRHEDQQQQQQQNRTNQQQQNRPFGVVGSTSVKSKKKSKKSLRGSAPGVAEITSKTPRGSIPMMSPSVGPASELRVTPLSSHRVGTPPGVQPRLGGSTDSIQPQPRRPHMPPTPLATASTGAAESRDPPLQQQQQQQQQSDQQRTHATATSQSSHFFI